MSCSTKRCRYGSFMAYSHPCKNECQHPEKVEHQPEQTLYKEGYKPEVIKFDFDSPAMQETLRILKTQFKTRFHGVIKPDQDDTSLPE